MVLVQGGVQRLLAQRDLQLAGAGLAQRLLEALLVLEHGLPELQVVLAEHLQEHLLVLAAGPPAYGGWTEHHSSGSENVLIHTHTYITFIYTYVR